MFRFPGFIVKTVEKFKHSYSSFRCGSIRSYTKISILPNGLRVATEESGAPLACVALFVEAGPVYEKPSNYGITHFIEHMAYRGFKSMSKVELESYLASIGATMTVLTTREFQVFSSKCPSENVSDIVGIFSKIITDLELSQSEIDMAKHSIELESVEADKNLKLSISDFLHETAFQRTPLGRRVMGPSRLTRKFDKSAVESYIKEFYYPARFVLATSGTVPHEEMVNCAQTCFNKIDPTCDVKYCPSQRYTGSQITFRDDEIPFVHVAIAVEAPGYGSPDYLMMLLASNIIGSWCKSQGGHDRHGSYLARAAATSNLCDSFESFYIAYRDIGLWGIYIVANMLDIDDMILNVQDRWMHLCTTTLYNDVERGINTTKMELARGIEGSVKSCYDVGVQTLYTSERKDLSKMYIKLSQANEKIIRNVTTRYIYDKCQVVAAIGPTEVVPDYTRIRAGMYWLRL